MRGLTDPLRTKKLSLKIDAAWSTGIQVGLLELSAGLSCSGQFLVRNIAPRIELCGWVETRRQIGPGGGSGDSQAENQESETETYHSL